MDWVLHGEVCPRSEQLPLFCFPCAGGNSTLFVPWASAFADQFLLLPVEVPGKGRRSREPHPLSIEQVARDFGRWLIDHISSEFVIFGHSMGAVIAFEVCRFLQTHRVYPRCVVLAGCGVPGRMKQRAAQLSDQELVGRLRELNGTPQEILDSPDLLKLVLPTIKADFVLLNDYLFCPTPVLESPILALTGRQDPEVLPSAPMLWGKYTRGHFACEVLEGDHFFIHDQVLQIKQVMMKFLSHLHTSTGEPGALGADREQLQGI